MTYIYMANGATLHVPTASRNDVESDINSDATMLHYDVQTMAGNAPHPMTVAVNPRLIAMVVDQPITDL